jgi:arginyl-tRNA synthetase
MTPRAGNRVTLQDVIEEVGVDIARFFYLHRKADAQLDFDLDLALKKSDENPVYYVQYAYVRTGSILEKSMHVAADFNNIGPQDVLHISSAEDMLLKKIASLGPLLASIGTHYQVHQLTYYVIELANLFHAYYSKNRVIEMTDISKSRGRLLVIMTLRDTFATVLDLLGISRPEKM